MRAPLISPRTRELAQRLAPQLGQTELRQASVASINAAGTLNLYLAGATDTLVPNVAYLGSAAPIIGASVWVLRNGTDYLALGPLASVGAPACRVRRDADQTLPNNTETTITFDTVMFDPHDMWNGATSIILPMDGIYQACGHTRFATNATGFRRTLIQHAGVTIAVQDTGTAVPATNTIQTLPVIFQGAAGDAITLRAHQNSGGNLNASGSAAFGQSLAVTYLGPIGA